MADIVKYVRGNTMLLCVTLTEQHEKGDPTVVDVETYDSWEANVYRCGIQRTKAEGVVVGVDEDKRVTLILPSSLICGTYSVEVLLARNDVDRRSFECTIFEVVETNGEADITYSIIDGMRSADIDMKFQFVETDAILGENAYEEWKKLPGNEDKTMQDFIDEVLNLNQVAANANAAADRCDDAVERCDTAIENASHLPKIGNDNYVYEWDVDSGSYVKTDIYVKGDKGDRGLEGPRGYTGPQGIQGERGLKGEKGDTGKDFSIYKTYASYAAMVADMRNVPLGEFVLISSNISDPDNATLYVRVAESSVADGFNFLTDLSGAQGIKGERGPQGNTGPAGAGVPTGGTTGQVLKKKSNSDYDTEWWTGPDVSGKADKVGSATSGNFAALDSNGNLTDSGHKHSDYLSSSTTIPTITFRQW